MSLAAIQFQTKCWMVFGSCWQIGLSISFITFRLKRFTLVGSESVFTLHRKFLTLDGTDKDQITFHPLISSVGLDEAPSLLDFSSSATKQALCTMNITFSSECPNEPILLLELSYRNVKNSLPFFFPKKFSNQWFILFIPTFYQ